MAISSACIYRLLVINDKAIYLISRKHSQSKEDIHYVLIDKLIDLLKIEVARKLCFFLLFP